LKTVRKAAAGGARKGAFRAEGEAKEKPMPSNTHKTRLIRKKKDKPNKENRKADQKRMQKNLEILAKASAVTA